MLAITPKELDADCYQNPLKCFLGAVGNHFLELWSVVCRTGKCPVNVYSSNVVSIDTVLKAYTGDPIRVDRKGREAESIDSPALTMLLSAQESVLEGMLTNDAFRGRGLLGRFLYCINSRG